MNTMTAKLSTVVILTALAPAGVAAQLPQASAAALGLGYNMTASARGFTAMANNPAGLGHPASPGFSLALFPVSTAVGLGPVGWSDLVDWQGQVVPDATKSEWLDRIAAADGLSGGLDLGGSAFALNVGPVGLQVGHIVGGDIGLSPGAAELLLFGNAGLTGAPADFDLEDSSVDGFALSTAAVSYGLQLSPRLAAGITAKYTMGHGLVVGRDDGSTLTSDPLGLQVQFPVVFTETDDYDYNQGTGVGLDVGALWIGPTLTLGASVQNVVHTFEWRLDDMRYSPGYAVYDAVADSSDVDERPVSEAPASVLEIIEASTIKPVLSAGAAWRPSSLLEVQADVRKRVSGGLPIGPEEHVGVGAELGLLSFLPLRAHVSWTSEGTQVGGGASLVLGPVNLSAAGAYRTGARDAVLAMFALSFGAN